MDGSSVNPWFDDDERRILIECVARVLSQCEPVDPSLPWDDPTAMTLGERLAARVRYRMDDGITLEESGAYIVAAAHYFALNAEMYGHCFVPPGLRQMCTEIDHIHMWLENELPLTIAQLGPPTETGRRPDPGD